MAAKKTLEVVRSLPEQDLEALLAPRLADELLESIDMAKLSRLAISHMGKKFQQRFIDWLMADNSAPVPMNEIEAASEEVAA